MKCTADGSETDRHRHPQGRAPPPQHCSAPRTQMVQGSFPWVQAAHILPPSNRRVEALPLRHAELITSATQTTSINSLSPLPSHPPSAILHSLSPDGLFHTPSRLRSLFVPPASLASSPGSVPAWLMWWPTWASPGSQPSASSWRSTSTATTSLRQVRECVVE